MTEPLGNYGVPTEPEWLIRANAGITTKTEIPRIIPPLPEGDTTDLKVWKEYWKQHDTAIRNATLDAIPKLTPHEYAHVAIMLNNCRCVMCKRISKKIESLRTKEQP